ncbi:unnamed protein product [Pseudo-nitzschia multistriata]|uniref:Pyrroline-5-carboxylate reductase catalytic N-terminal domain-containing protein n=1 Tax=Pseudo-nitzschia multistriata TaxID=183589 RepID=A0A448YV70_9STRA|nr:unnamed protein product [Pseudo-nitzschia multistriata]
MSLVNQTCWVVGGVGVIGRGITRGLLNAGATVIVNSRSPERLNTLSRDLGHPERLVTIEGSLLPGYASKTVRRTLDANALSLNHVVAHGAVRYWGDFGKANGNRRDESHVVISPSGIGRSLLQTTTPEEFMAPASQLASLHFSAAQELIPRIQFSNGPSSYTFVTGDAGGHPKGYRSAFGEINTHHVWGLAAALRNERFEKDVNCREIRVRLPVNRPVEERRDQPRENPLSEDIGTLCAGLATTSNDKKESGALIEIADQASLESLLDFYEAALCG